MKRIALTLMAICSILFYRESEAMYSMPTGAPQASAQTKEKNSLFDLDFSLEQLSEVINRQIPTADGLPVEDISEKCKLCLESLNDPTKTVATSNLLPNCEHAKDFHEECLVDHFLNEKRNWENYEGLFCPICHKTGKLPSLLEAISDNNTKLALKLIENGAEINKDPEAYLEDSPLVKAIEKNNLSVFKALLRRPDIDVNIKGIQETPLTQVVENDNKQMLNALLKAKFNIKPNLENNLGNAPLHTAVNNRNVEIVKKLIGHPDIDINLKRSLDMLTPLDIAKQKNYPEIIELLEPKPTTPIVEEEPMCEICFEKLDDPDRPIAPERMLPNCDHSKIYHQECLEKWFEGKFRPTCPKCRKPGVNITQRPAYNPYGGLYGGNYGGAGYGGNYAGPGGAGYRGPRYGQYGGW